MRRNLISTNSSRIDENLLLTVCGYAFCSMSLISLLGWFTLYFASPIRLLGA